MKLIFLLMIFYIHIFCEATPKEKKIRKQEYYYQDYHSEEGKFGKKRRVETKIYDDKGNPVEERRMYFGDIDEVIKFTFDEDNRLKEMDLWNEMRSKNKKIIYHYKGNKIAEKSIYKGDELVDKEINIFDSEGNLMRVENRRGELIDYLYDEKGRIVMKNDGVVKNYYSYDDEHLTKDVCEIDEIPVYCREFTYDSDGNIVKFIEKTPGGFKKGVETVKETVYNYNKKGDKVEERWRENTSPIWYIKRMENKYNENGDLIEVKEFEIRKTGEEFPSREHHYRYEYH